MINCIVIRNEGIGTKDFDHNVLYDAIRDLISTGEIEYASLIAQYSFPTDVHFAAFTSGMEAVGVSDEYAYVWEDTQSSKYEEQHEDYSRFEKLLKDYLN